MMMQSKQSNLEELVGLLDTKCSNCTEQILSLFSVCVCVCDLFCLVPIQIWSVVLCVVVCLSNLCLLIAWCAGVV